MAWTTPRTWVALEVVTAALLNAHLRDNMNLTSPALVTTKGDLIVALGANNPSRLGVGTDGYLLRANSATGSGLEWTAYPGHDHVDVQGGTTSGTWTKPANATVCIIKLGSGAGGGAGSSASSQGGGAQGGSGVFLYCDASDLAATEAVTIGAGGAAGAANSDGTAGNDSTFNTATWGDVYATRGERGDTAQNTSHEYVSVTLGVSNGGRGGWDTGSANAQDGGFSVDGGGGGSSGDDGGSTGSGGTSLHGQNGGGNDAAGANGTTTFVAGGGGGGASSRGSASAGGGGGNGAWQVITITQQTVGNMGGLAA